MNLEKSNKDLSFYINYHYKFTPKDIFLTKNKIKITYENLYLSIVKVHNFLRSKKIRKNQIIIGYFDNSIEQIYFMLGVITFGAIWVPLSNDREKNYLNHILQNINFVEIVTQKKFIKNFSKKYLSKINFINKNFFQLNSKKNNYLELIKTNIHKPCCIIFTSGTSGPPKGVLVTQKMLVLSAIGNQLASNQKDNDRYLLWESLHHIAGMQLIVMRLISNIQVFLMKRFSSKNFWRIMYEKKITKLHYLGGILEILLKNKKNFFEKKHYTNLAYGAGCRKDIFLAFQKRFNIPIREVYGMTESSSFTSINYKNTPGIIGKVLPWLNLSLFNQGKKIIKKNLVGEIGLKEKVKGSITPGYYGKKSINKNNFFLTGDLAKFNKDNDLIYVGRSTDSIRKKGINISSWEIETVLNSHKLISESAALSIPAQIGENEILAILLINNKNNKKITDIRKLTFFFKKKFSKFSFPRYWAFISSFPRTPTLRIDKKNINIKLLNIFDSVADKYKNLE